MNQNYNSAHLVYPFYNILNDELVKAVKESIPTELERCIAWLLFNSEWFESLDLLGAAFTELKLAWESKIEDLPIPEVGRPPWD